MKGGEKMVKLGKDINPVNHAVALSGTCNCVIECGSIPIAAYYAGYNTNNRNMRPGY